MPLSIKLVREILDDTIAQDIGITEESVKLQRANGGLGCSSLIVKK